MKWVSIDCNCIIRILHLTHGLNSLVKYFTLHLFATCRFKIVSAVLAFVGSQRKLKVLIHVGEVLIGHFCILSESLGSDLHAMLRNRRPIPGCLSYHHGVLT